MKSQSLFYVTMSACAVATTIASIKFMQRMSDMTTAMTGATLGLIENEKDEFDNIVTSLHQD